MESERQRIGEVLRSINLLFLPPLVAFLVKVTSAVAAAHIVCSEPFKALMAV
jgi:hypothetical protein